MKTRDELNHISGIILTSSIAVHKEMGPGLLESVYQHCLIKELTSKNLNVKTAFPIPLMYKGEALDKDYCIDLFVEDEIIIELKATEGINPLHEAQLLSYMKLSNRRLGLLINFNVVLLKDGFRRLVYKF
jgi:GxxExxY protein